MAQPSLHAVSFLDFIYHENSRKNIISKYRIVVEIE